jgi:hypothetical protein
MMTCRVVKVLKLIPRTIVNSLSFAGIETFVARCRSDEWRGHCDVDFFLYFYSRRIATAGASKPQVLRQAHGRLFDGASRDKTASGGGRDDSSSINRTLIHPVIHGLPLYV